MGKHLPKVLITCTEPRASAICQDLNHHNIDAVPCPALTVQEIEAHIPNRFYDAILLSSTHAIKPCLPNLPVITVGHYTATIAKQKKLNVIQTGDGSVQDLNLSSYQSILYPCAQEPSFIPDNATAWPVYETVENSNFFIPKVVNVICIFSKKAAEILLRHCEEFNDEAIQDNPAIKTLGLPRSRCSLAKTTLICLSEHIAETLKTISCAELVVCARPDYDLMKELIISKVKD